MRNTLTAFVPAHKQSNPEHKPGQQVNPLGFTIEQTLGQYVARVRARDAFDAVAQEKKLTFEEWYARNELLTYDKTEYDCMKMAWEAALVGGR